MEGYICDPLVTLSTFRQSINLFLLYIVYNIIEDLLNKTVRFQISEFEIGLNIILISPDWKYKKNINIVNLSCQNKFLILYSVTIHYCS